MNEKKEADYVRLAKLGKPMPDGLTWAEQGHFQAIAHLTERYRAGNISAEEAAKEKGMIDQSYRDAALREAYLREVSDGYAEVEYRALFVEEDRSDKNIDNLLSALNGVTTIFREPDGMHKQWMREETRSRHD